MKQTSITPPIEYVDYRHEADKEPKCALPASHESLYKEKLNQEWDNQEIRYAFIAENGPH